MFNVPVGYGAWAVVDSGENNCSICLEAVSNGSLCFELSCGHGIFQGQMHAACLLKACDTTSPRCPLCRKAISASDYSNLSGGLKSLDAQAKAENELPDLAKQVANAATSETFTEVYTLDDYINHTAQQIQSLQAQGEGPQGAGNAGGGGEGPGGGGGNDPGGGGGDEPGGGGDVP